MTAFLICKVSKEKVDIKLYRSDRYSSFSFDKRKDALDAVSIANQFMYLDNIVFGYSKFEITDKRLYNYSNVPLSQNGSRFLYLKPVPQQKDYRTMGTIYVTGTACYDAWVSGNGDLVGVPPGGSINYGGYWETRCYSYIQVVQIFNYDMSGGSPSSPPAPGSGSGGNTTTATGQFWDSTPCEDPNGWQTPDAPTCRDGVIGWQPVDIVVSEEYNPNLPATDPDEQWWNDNSMSFPQQTLPSWSTLQSNYPKDAFGEDLAATEVYKLIGGTILNMRNANPQDFVNACAARVSRALNYSGITIPNIPNHTFQGADGKYYFLGAAKMYNWMIKTFGTTNAIVLNQSDGGPNGSLFASHLSGQKGIFLMKPVDIKAFGATGHATIYDGNGCVGGVDHCYFGATGGVAKVVLFKLN